MAPSSASDRWARCVFSMSRGLYIGFRHITRLSLEGKVSFHELIYEGDMNS